MNRLFPTARLRQIGMLRPLFQFTLLGAATLVAGICGSAQADPVPAKGKGQPVQCRWARGEIKIDGVADEGDWKNAIKIDAFKLPWLREKQRPPRTSTSARLLWDRDNLYFFADMEDSDLYADVKEHDGETWSNDVFELFFKPADDKPGYYEFQVNAAGTVMDMFIPRRGSGGFQRYKKDGEFHIQAKVKRSGTLNKWSDRDTGWTVEGKLPWTAMLKTGGRPNPDEVWKFALCRYDYSVDFEGPELSTNAPLDSKPHADFHRHEDYASLRFVGPRDTPLPSDAKPVGIKRLVPLTTSRVAGSPEPPPPYIAERAFAQLKLNFPIAVARQPGGNKLIVIHQDRSYGATKILRLTDSADAKEAETLHTLETTAYGVAFHPDFQKNGYLFVGHNGKSEGFEGKTTRISRFTMQTEPPFAIDPKSERVIIEWESDGHNGGDLVFGLDGMLYVTSGDGTSDSDTNLKGQGLDHVLSKVLRIDVDHPADGKHYGVPKDNPFLDVDGARPETWAYGFRNPWRITVDKKQGHIWVGNNGQDLWEQAYLVERGANYGWSVYEGGHVFYANRKRGPTPISKPTVEHPHSEARSLTGGVVYHGDGFPELRGAYIYGDHSTGKIWAVRHDGKKILWHKEIADTSLRISGFGTDSRGELLICNHEADELGGLYSLKRNPNQATNEQFPRKLSETGLFRNVKNHQVQPALIPYSVNSPLWSDHAHKERFMALPGDEPKIEVTANRGWDFPEQTVLVKSFALDLREGRADSRHWIETRLLTKQQGEWVGYSYRWNDEQTDAMLVGKEGADQHFDIRTASGVRRQTWRYPSRTECMVCHSRAAKFVLGPSTLQMNKDHDYGGVVDNQLRVLEHLGVLQINYRKETLDHMREQAKSDGKTDSEASAYIAQQTATRDQRAASNSSLLSYAPRHYDRLADPYDESADLDARARSYLHANCSICHVDAGGGNAQINLEFTVDREKTKLFDIKPLHHTFDIADARLVSPGNPDQSILLHRVSIRERGQMPQLASSLVDEKAVAMLRRWIEKLEEAP